MGKGVTVIELLLVISIVAIVAAAATPFLSSFVLRNNLEVTTARVIGTIRKAQNYSQDGKNDEVWGVCLTGGNLRLFSASCTSPSFSEDFSVPKTVKISGLSETFFSKLRGEPSNSLNITITTDIGTSTVQLNEAGGMGIN